MRRSLPEERNSCNALPHCLVAVGSGTASMHCHTSMGEWEVQVLQCAATPHGGSRQCYSCNALPHRVGAVGIGTPAICGPTSWGDGESYPVGGRCLKMVLLQCTASLPGGSGHWNSYNTMPHCLGAVGGGTLAMRRATSRGDGESYLGGGRGLKSARGGW